MAKFLKYIKYASAIFFLIYLGFARDYLFVNLNYQLSKTHYHSFEYHLPPVLSFLEGLDEWTLYYLKYVFTALAIFLFFLATFWAVHVFFGEKKYRRWVLYSYVIIILASGFIFLALYWFFGFDPTYLIVRKLLDFAESPIMAMVLIPLIVVHKKMNENK
ncbi:MAG: hypothetical protein IAF38_17335 [Bacteroidia bacterium]|nr:hypothetical protein [Bacteroidia bacterium]